MVWTEAAPNCPCTFQAHTWQQLLRGDQIIKRPIQKALIALCQGCVETVRRCCSSRSRMCSRGAGGSGICMQHTSMSIAAGSNKGLQ
jgi:hypothetical protein